MADLPYIQQRQEISITGQDSTGDQVNYVSADSSGNLAVKDAADGTDGATAPTYTIQAGGKDFNGNLQTVFTDTTGRVYVDLCDGLGNTIDSYNLQIPTADIINTAITSGTLTVSTSAVAARVSTSNLANRKVLVITPTSGTVYLGATSGVTTSTGMPIFANQTAVFSFSTNITPYLIAASSTSVFIMEGS